MKQHQKESDLVDRIDTQSPQIGKISSPAGHDSLHKSGLFRACFADAALGLSITDLQGRFLEVNPAYCAITGYSKAELCGLDVQTITHIDDLPASLTNLRSLIAGEIPLFVMEERYVRKDGIVVWVENSVSLTRDQEGGPMNLVRISQDISARRQLEDSLRKAKEFSETLIQTANTIILGLDINGKIRIFNRAAEEITGYSRQELEGKDWFKTLVPKERYPNVSSGFNQLVAGGANKTFENPILTKSGQERHILWRNNQVVVDGKVVATISFGTDVTERKATEEALRIAEQQYRDIFNNAGEGIFQTTPEGRYIAANPALARMHGFASPMELIKSRTNISREVYVDPHHREEFKRLMEEQGTVREFEHQIFRQDGSRIWISVNARAVRDQQGAILYYEGTAQDITERKRAEQALRASEERYRKLADNFPNGAVSTFDKDLRMTFIAGKGLERDNLSADFFIGKSLNEIAPPEVVAIVEPHFRAAFAGKAVSYECSYPDGRIYFASVAPLFDEKGINEILVIAQNVTEHKAIENNLKQSENQLAEAQRLAHVGSWNWDRETDDRIWSEELYRIFGLPSDLPAPDLGATLLECVHPEDREIVKSSIERSMQDKEACSFSYRIVRPDGAERIVQARGNVATDSSGNLIRMFGTAQDITERRRAEADLRESEELFSRAFHCSPAPLIITRLVDGCFLKANDAFLRAFEYERAEVIGQTVASLNIYIHAGDRKDLIDDLQERGNLRGYESQARTKSGRILDLWIFVEPIKLKGEECLLSTAYDITERKCVEEALRESEERYRDLVENSREFICTHDLAGKILSANRAGTELLGYDPNELIGKKSIQDILAPEARHQFEEYMARLTKEGFASGVMLVQTRSGERRLWEYYNTLRTAGVATPIVRGMARDISEQRRAEQSLHLFRNLLDQSNDAIEVIDPITFRFIDCNESAYRSLGYSREEFLSLTVFDINPLIDRSTMESHDEDMKESGFANFESIHVRKDGTTFPVEVNVKLVRLETDYRLAVVRDITRRRLTEEALRKSEERYRELFENARDPIYVHDLSGRYTSVNRAAEQLSGFSRDEIIGKHYSNFVAPPDLKHARTNLCRKLDEDSQTIYEVNVLNRSGRRIPVEVSSRLIFEKDVAVGVQGTARDITDRKRAQEALHIYSQRLIAAQEAEREKIARELHDEIGQVLTAVRINLQSIQRSRGANENARPLVESIAIVDEALGRVRELSIELRPALLDDLGLSAALRWYVDRYAQRTGIIAEVLNGSDEDVRLPRDIETVCFRIAQEALTNVARHAQAVSVSVQLERARDRILLTVIDDGVGFDVIQLRKNAPASSALGLRGMEERALAVGGYIEIDSGVERGTRIRGIFPLKRNQK